MNKLATRVEIQKLARVLGVGAEHIGFLRVYPAEHLRHLREAVSELLFRREQKLFQRLARWFGWLPAWLLALAARVFSPLLLARVAGEMPAGLFVAAARRTPIRILMDAAIELDPRCARDLIRRMPLEILHASTVELRRRGDFMTAGRFWDFLPDETLRPVIEALDDEGVLRAMPYTESKNRLDRLIHLMPEERLRRLILLAEDESTDLAVQLLAIWTQVSYGLQRRLGDLIAEQPDALLGALVRTAEREELWAELLPAVANMSHAGLRRVVNLPILADPAVLRSIGQAADEHDLWDIALPLIEMMDDAIRAAVARDMGQRSRQSLVRMVDAALVNECWEPLLDVVARMPQDKQQEFAGIVHEIGDVDPRLLHRIRLRAEAYQLGELFAAT